MNFLRYCLGSLPIVFAFVAFLNAETVVFDASKAETPGTKVSFNRVATKTEDGVFLFTNKEKYAWPGVSFQGKWSLVANDVFVMELENRGENSVRVSCRLDSPEANPDTGKRTFTQSVLLLSGEKRRWEIAPPRQLPKQLRDKLFGMRGYPGGVHGDTDGKIGENSFDPADLVTVIVFYGNPSEEHTVGIKKIFIGPPQSGSVEIASRNASLEFPPEKFFPMIDRYGQYVHADWPGKIKSDADLKKNRETEEKELTAMPKPADRNQYGGWTKGPKLEATGHFYAVKRNGIWWLVDPEGCLFWSHGVDCVRATTGETPISDREYLYAEFPVESCFGKGGWAVHGYYVGKTPYKTYHFTMSNLELKYGGDWKRLFCETAHRRLHAWGMNTIANWSGPEVYNLRQTPYTATLGTSGPVIAGSKGYWGQFKDPFHPEFRQGFAATMSRQKETAVDPWCIGFFVDNELGWGSDTSLSAAAMVSPATQPAKIAMVDMLRKKYEKIDKLNAAWKTAHADWNALLSATDVPDKKNETIQGDLRDGYSLIAEKYFSVIRDELKKIAPNKLFFGCRFAWVNDSVVRAADRYCDVISFNCYDVTLNGFKLPEGVDKAVIIGEFHFGALDRGMLHTGLQPTANQKARAETYEKYVRSALEHPNIVGTHWFQYGDQATTGRGGDGENYQIGLVDICDTPYPETIDAVRRVGITMYDLRQDRTKSIK